VAKLGVCRLELAVKVVLPCPVELIWERDELLLQREGNAMETTKEK
jgi:hypothetical protein